jgi:signal transduction histidine kinase
MPELALANRPFAARALLRRVAGVAGKAGTVGAAILAGLLACALIGSAALTLNASADRASEMREIRAVVASGGALTATPDSAQSRARFAEALATACDTLDAESPYRPLLATLCDSRGKAVPNGAVLGAAVGAAVDRLAAEAGAGAEALIEGVALRSRNALLEIAGAIAALAFAGLVAGILLVRATHGHRNDVLRETIEALPAGVVLYDKRERLLMFNSRAAEISGARLAEGKTYEEMARETARTMEQAGHGPQPVEEWLARFRRKDGKTTRRTTDGRWFDWSERLTPSGYTVGLRVDVSEKIRHEQALEHARAEYQSLVASLTDIVIKVDFASGVISFASAAAADETDWRRAEQALHDSERFATVGEMAGTMAHELSQPLQVINLACASAHEELNDAMDRGEPADSAYMKQKLDRIAQQVDDASRIVGELRAFVRGEADRQPAPFDPAPAFQRALKLTAHGMRQAGIASSLTLAERLPAVVGDVGRLEQVMVNLLNNARDAGGRKVEIVAGATIRDDRTFLRIAVQDSGPGIPADLLPQLFVSFVTTKPRGTGTGLGLRICRRIIEEMGGSISASNRPQGGACFEVLLPASEPQAQSIAA